METKTIWNTLIQSGEWIFWANKVQTKSNMLFLTLTTSGIQQLRDEITTI